jgi:hypothetical protein
MYRISNNIRKYSATPVVEVTIDDKGKEKEEIVCVCFGKKADADILSEKIVKWLNQ